MIRLAFAQARTHWVRLALTLVAILLGVAFVTGSLVLNDTAQRLFDEQFRTASAGADLTVRTATAFDSGMGVEVERDPIEASVVEEITAVDGVTAAIPAAAGAARLERGTSDLGGIRLSTWVEPPVGAFPVRIGHAPQSVGEVVLDMAGAERLGVSIGDRLTLQAATDVPVRVVGLVGFGGADGLPSGAAVLAPLATAQQALGIGDQISEVLVISERPVADLRPDVVTAVGSDLQVATAQDLATAGAEAAAANLKLLQIVLIAMSIAALLIGSFLIANTFRMVVSQRSRELALVRAAGATGGQVLRSVLVEAGIVGLAASALGVVAGIAGTWGLRALATASGVSIPDGPLVLEPRVMLLAAASGVVVTLLAALGPARRAGRISPVLALRESAAEVRSLGRARLVTGAALLVTGSAVAVAPTFGMPLALLTVGLALAIAGVVMVGPAMLRPIVRLVGLPLRHSLAGALARESALRSPRRTSSTVMALALGLALMGFVAIVGSSVKDATGEQYREVVTAEAVIESAGQEMLGGVHSQVFDEVETLPEVGAIARLKYGHWRDGNTIDALSAFDPAAIKKVAAITMVDGSIDALRDGGVVIAERVAVDRDLAVGDAIDMTFARTGETKMPIVGILADASARAFQTDFYVSLDAYAANFTEDMDASVFVDAADGVGHAALTSALERQLLDHPTAQVRDQAAVVEGRTKAVDQIFGLVTVLLGFAMVIAVLGIANTLALSIVERTREFGMLRAVGMSRRTLAGLVRSEALIVAVTAVVAGTVLAVLGGLAAIGGLAQIAPLVPRIPWDQLAILAAVVAVAGVLAGLAPSRRAARIPVLEAIAHA